MPSPLRAGRLFRRAGMGPCPYGADRHDVPTPYRGLLPRPPSVTGSFTNDPYTHTGLYGSLTPVKP